MDNSDPELRAIVDRLRELGHYAGSPPLPPPPSGAIDPPMPQEPSLEPRVNRLEMGFCAAVVLIFGAIITSYLMLAGKFDATRDRIENVEVSQVRLEGKAESADKKLDSIVAKLEKR